MLDLFALLGPVFVLATLAGIFVMLTGWRPRGGGRGIRIMPSRLPGPTTLLAGVFVSLSIGSVLEGFQLPWEAAAGWGCGLGLLLGILYAVQSELVLGIVYCVIGVVALVPAVSDFVSAADCIVVDPGWRVPALILVVLLAMGGGVLGFIVRRRFYLASALALTAGIEILLFASSPLGISLASLGAPAWIAAGVLAILVGFATTYSPEFVIGAGAVVLSVTLLGVGVVAGSACSEPDTSGVLIALVFVVVFIVTAKVGSAIRPR